MWFEINSPPVLNAVLTMLPVIQGEKRDKNENKLLIMFHHLSK